ncbi:hypothetical protein PFL603g_06445 [Pseudomonas fluorescens]|uniref:Uncharacterized protein n=1 Tax=Pseudomonas fluorescens TaxID=294 RepID=A0A125QCG5_PSEFL|nr:hypothetical protein PFL603g_06445 [Pseudomonas fluorescens]
MDGRRVVAAAGRGTAIQPPSAEVQRVHMRAMRGVPGFTRQAQATRHVGHDHVITGGDGGHRGPYRLHNSRTFMAQHDWQRRRKQLVTHNHISVANTGRDDTHAHFICARNAQLCALQLELAAGLTQYGNFDFNGCKGALGHLLILFNRSGLTVSTYAVCSARGRLLRCCASRLVAGRN